MTLRKIFQMLRCSIEYWSSDNVSTTGAALAVVYQRLSILDPNEPRPRVLEIPPGYKQAGENRSWFVYAAPLCHYFEK